jgi:excisionase family DNA binding protein
MERVRKPGDVAAVIAVREVPLPNGGTSAGNGELPQFTTRHPPPQTLRGQVERHFEPLLNDSEASALLGGIHPKTLQRLARRGQIPAYRVGRFWRYRASELDSWLRSGVNSARQPARVDVTKETSQ